MKRPWIVLVFVFLVILISGLFVACGGSDSNSTSTDSTPVAPTTETEPSLSPTSSPNLLYIPIALNPSKTTLQPGENVVISVLSSEWRSARLIWSLWASSPRMGTLSSNFDPTVVYTAPEEPGTVTVSVGGALEGKGGLTEVSFIITDDVDKPVSPEKEQETSPTPAVEGIVIKEGETFKHKTSTQALPEFANYASWDIVDQKRVTVPSFGEYKDVLETTILDNPETESYPDAILSELFSISDGSSPYLQERLLVVWQPDGKDALVFRSPPNTTSFKDWIGVDYMPQWRLFAGHNMDTHEVGFNISLIP